MMRVLEFLGYTEGNNRSDRFTFIITCVGIFQLATFMIFYYVFTDSKILVIQTAIALLGYLSSFYFLRKKKPWVSKILVSGIVAVQTMLLVWVWFPSETYLDFYYFLLPPASFIMFDISDKKNRAYVIVYNSIIVISVMLGVILEPLALIKLEDSVLAVLRTLSATSAIAIEVYVFYFYAKSLSDSYKELKLIALTDIMTGVPNRRCFFEKGEPIFDSSDNIHAVILDIDNFKAINDKYGHPIGDEVIKLVAETVSNYLEDSDNFARIGGEEFAIISTSYDDTSISEKMEILRAAVEECKIFLNSGEVLRFSISIGIVAKTLKHNSLDTLLNDADAALYEAKETGRNRVIFRV